MSRDGAIFPLSLYVLAGISGHPAAGSQEGGISFASCSGGTEPGQGFLLVFYAVGQPWAQVLKGSHQTSLELPFFCHTETNLEKWRKDNQRP